MLILLGLVPAKHRRARALLLMAVTCALCLERLAALHGPAVRGGDPQAQARLADAHPAPPATRFAAVLASGVRFEPPQGLDDVADWGVPTYGASMFAVSDFNTIAP